MVFRGEYVRWLPPDIRRRAKASLRRVALAPTLETLRFPPSQRLEALRGDREGQYSVRINDQWRICFTWTAFGATEIEVTDYH